MLPTVALFASSRRNGNTGRLMDRIAAQLGIDVIDIGQKRLSAYDYEHGNRDDDFEPLIDHVLNFKQIIFASPVYWYAVCPPMKILLDRIADLSDLPDLMPKGRRLRGKHAYIVCTSRYDDAPEPFIGALEQTFDDLGLRFEGYVHANCRDGYKASSYECDIDDFVERVKRCGSEQAAGA